MAIRRSVWWPPWEAGKENIRGDVAFSCAPPPIRTAPTTGHRHMTANVLIYRLAAIAVLALAAAPAAAAPSQQTIVFTRHAEKPAAGLGLIDCQGLNRALALPRVLAAKFGRPDAIFAPDPHQRVRDHGHDYNYVRPLATIVPTAVHFERPITTAFGYKDVVGLRRELTRRRYHDMLVFVAWEHAFLVKVVRQLVADLGGDAGLVPDWAGSDFDGLYVLRITRDGGRRSVAFTRETQGLDGRPAACP
jgi:hypothetical protein